MTKEELEKEAEENSFRYTLDKPWVCEVERKQIMAHFKKGYLASAEPREKRIAELEEAKANLEYLLEGRDNEIDELKKENKNLAQNLEDTEICENGWKNRVTELEAQIGKMKCCGNCVHFDFTEPNYCHKGVYRANQKVCGEWCFGN